MAVNGGGKIVTDGLVFALDASSPRSYPGSGNTWYDLSGNDTNGSLSGGTEFATGSMHFDGVNSTINMGSGNTIFPLPEFTIDVIFRSFGTVPTTGTSPGLFGFTYGIRNFVTSTSLLYGVDNGTSLSTFSTTGTNNYRDGNWYHATFTTTSTTSAIYVNGVFSNSSAKAWSGTTRWPTNSLNIGRDNNNVHYFFYGEIPHFVLYNRALSAAEILQNYNALKGRFD